MGYFYLVREFSMYTQVPIPILEKATRHVFGVCARLSAFVLLLVLLVLPLAPVFADETVAGAQESPVEVVVPDLLLSSEESPSQHDTDQDLAEEGLSYDVVAPPTSELIQTDSNDVVSDSESSDEEGASVHEEEVFEENTPVEDTESTTTDDSNLETNTDGETVNDDIASTTTESGDADTSATTSEKVSQETLLADEDLVDEVEPVEEQEIDDVVSVDSDEVQEENASTTATSTDTIVGSAETVVLGANHVLHNEDDFLFSKNACVSVGDGSFYCTEATSTPAIMGADRVFSAVDSEGDREIYIEKEGQLVTITDNLFDDDAPFYDEVSESLVWHRLIEGRYQVVSYDLTSEEERVLTHDHYNNMEPSRYDTLTVWQGWVGDDWEIMIDEGNGVRMLTDNTYHDIAPRINSGYIIWQSFEENAWRVKVYDIYTGRIETIDDTEGMSLENPRFVLVYDAKHKNGDVETKGYDLQSKKIIPLSAIPVSIPDSLPDPEQTGEERALVQTPVQVKTKSETEHEGEVPVDQVLDDVVDPTTLHIDDVIVDLFDPQNASSSESDTVLSSELGEVVETGEVLVEDLTITTFVSESASEVPLIEDLIITPYVEQIEASLDPQAEVASST